MGNIIFWKEHSQKLDRWELESDDCQVVQSHSFLLYVGIVAGQSHTRVASTKVVFQNHCFINLDHLMF